MSSLQQRIASYTALSTDLISQLSELDQLRDRVREAQSKGEISRRERSRASADLHVRARTAVRS